MSNLSFSELEKQYVQFQKNICGKIGESVISEYASTLEKDIYYPLNDLVLKTGRGTTQIDQVIVSKFGIFVVEVKNINGLIRGNINQPKWICQPFNRKPYQFYNPLHQNVLHARTIKRLLDISQKKLISMIVFIGGVFDSAPDNIISSDNYLSYIRSYNNRLITDEEVKAFVKIIIDNQLSPKDHQEYISQINKKLASGEIVPKCPRCNKKMIRRIAKQGPRKGKPFWGCSSFPSCRGTVNIKTEEEKVKEEIQAFFRLFDI
ncbi:NERD domain-containing protein [Desulfobacterales bacterium HSG2]|nr:NERD domain-containing protein [Desulfobacterales bacterium HSG2]